MENESSLEKVLQQLRSVARLRDAPSNVQFNQHHRQFLDQLRHAHWVAASKLPDSPKARLTLLRNGWIETRYTAKGEDYRITPSGLAEVSKPR